MSANNNSSPQPLLDTENTIFQKAVSFVNYTSENLFLTGRAGTGKTTFLKYIRQNTKKKCAIVAPTGVAAMNAGGETIHSFLQVPIGPFVPGSMGGFGNQPTIAEDKHSLLAKLKLKDVKIKLLQHLELLIIDEVSMVRCDLLDAMDLILRHVRKKWSQPFGGLQVVFIGDLFQLPPVTKREDWEILGRFYKSPFFFDSWVLHEKPPLYLELKKIYRQKEEKFIHILNNIRNGNTQLFDIQQLNERYNPNPVLDEGYITLSTHNKMVDTINKEALDKLTTKLFKFEGVIERDFNPKNYPTDPVLCLKEGAQVMFIKNDNRNPRRFYNGKIGTVAKIDEEGILVTFPSKEKPDSLRVEQETWSNIHYTLQPNTNEVKEEVLGSFKQYPIRLAWAVTIHKSQGLTLEKAIIDLDQAFASGQAYVALSRCTTLEGLVLRSKLSLDNIFVDERIIQFATTEIEEDELDEVLEQKMLLAKLNQIIDIFSFEDVIQSIHKTTLQLTKLKTAAITENETLIENLQSILKTAQEHAIKFQKQIKNLPLTTYEDFLKQRTVAANNYFNETVFEPCIKLLDEYFIFLGTLPKPGKQERLWKTEKENFLHLKEKMKDCWI